MELAKQINAIYQRISAKEDYHGIDELLKNIARKIIKLERKKKGEKLMKEQIENEKKKKKSC